MAEAGGRAGRQAGGCVGGRAGRWVAKGGKAQDAQGCECWVPSVRWMGGWVAQLGWDGWGAGQGCDCRTGRPTWHGKADCQTRAPAAPPGPLAACPAAACATCAKRAHTRQSQALKARTRCALRWSAPQVYAAKWQELSRFEIPGIPVQLPPSVTAHLPGGAEAAAAAAGMRRQRSARCLVAPSCVGCCLPPRAPCCACYCCQCQCVCMCVRARACVYLCARTHALDIESATGGQRGEGA